MRYVLPFLAVILLSACKSTKPLEITQTIVPENYISVSQGGGFTGAYETYYLFEGGKVYSKVKADSAFFTTLSRETVATLFSEAEALKLHNKAFSPPGNMNYLLSIRLENNLATATWADQFKPEADILEFYKNVLLLIKSPKR